MGTNGHITGRKLRVSYCGGGVATLPYRSSVGTTDTDAGTSVENAGANAMRITKNFNRSEFACNCAAKGFAEDTSWCGGESWVHRELVVRLQALRDHFNAPVTVTSGCRCPRYNEFVGGAPKSQHKRGTAADIVVQGTLPQDVAKAARDMGFYVLEYSTFVHVDIRQYI